MRYFYTKCESIDKVKFLFIIYMDLNFYILVKKNSSDITIVRQITVDCSIFLVYNCAIKRDDDGNKKQQK